MGGGEAALIRRHFHALTAQRDGVELGVGDDAALLDVAADGRLAACCDTLVAGVHFPADIPPEALGHRVLAVNLSDLAAVGAQPAWALLSVTLPEPDRAWLERFSAGFKTLADRYGVALVGGDTTHGPTAVSVTALGWVSDAMGLRRSGARPGDGVWVTGTLGDAARGLELWQGRDGDTLSGDPAYLVGRLFRPEPRLAAGQALLDTATSAIDISDGLAADLARVLEESGVGATLSLPALPRSPAFLAEGGTLRHALYGGDDYELCLTVPPSVAAEEMARLGERLMTPLTRVGTVEATPGLRGEDADGAVSALEPEGYDHFAGGA